MGRRAWCHWIFFFQSTFFILEQSQTGDLFCCCCFVLFFLAFSMLCHFCCKLDTMCPVTAAEVDRLQCVVLYLSGYDVG